MAWHGVALWLGGKANTHSQLVGNPNPHLNGEEENALVSLGVDY
jgi:hypothetical protein